MTYTPTRGFLIFAAILFGLGALPPHLYGQTAGFTLFGHQPDENVNLPSERRAVAPITTPYYHEDSFITSDVRTWFAYHKVPESSLLGGGNIKDYAAQFRLALTDNLQFVAYKDGYIDFNTDLIQDDGWNDLAAGLKWAFIQDWKHDFHMAVGAGYQFAIGDPDVLQNDQEARAWLSVNKGFDKLHLGGTANVLFNTGNEDPLGNSDRFLWNLHADYRLTHWLSPVVEMSGFHTFHDGDNHPLPFSGLDVANLGGGDDVVTIGAGFELRPLESLGVRIAYETPLTSGDDIYSYRWTASLIWQF